MAEASVIRIPEPLRLPRGSVRGLIALIVTATYAYLLLETGVAPAVLVNSVVVVIAFYFGTKAMGVPPPGPGPAPPPAPPMTPTRTRLVRILLLVGLVGLAGWFLRPPNPSLEALPPDLRDVLEVLAGYVSGVLVSWLVHRRMARSDFRRRLTTAARDLIAAGSLGLTAYACFALSTGQPTVFADRLVDALSLVVTFYFGSRVIGH